MEKNYSKTDIIGIILLIIVAQLIYGYYKGVFDGLLMDTDAYSWVNRVWLLYNEGHWFDSTLHDINPPLGHEQHWSRPFDALLFSGGLVLSPFFGFERGLHVWAAMLSPLLGILAYLGMIWANAIWMKQKQLEALGIAFVFMPALIVCFMIGRSDQQSLMLLLSVILAALNIRLLLRPHQYKPALFTGLLAALLIWSSLESLLVIALLFLTLSLHWIIARADSLKTLFFTSLGLAVGIWIFLFLEHGPQHLFDRYFDQISVVYASGALLNLLLWAALLWSHNQGLNLQSPLQRAIAAITGAAVVLAATEFLFPGFLKGPMHNMDPLYKEIRFNNISEIQPLLFSHKGWLKDIQVFILHLGIVLPVIPVLIHQLSKKDGKNYWVWIYMTLGALLFVPLATYQGRWSPYAILFILPSYAVLLASGLQWLEKKHVRQNFWLSIKRMGLYAFAMLWFFVPELLITDNSSASANSTQECSLKDISGFLQQKAPWSSRPYNILTFTDYGPELIFRTHHTVLSIPNHRFQQGFTDTYTIFHTTDEAIAYEQSLSSGVELILVCKLQKADIFSRKDDQKGFQDQLKDGNYPYWLQPIPLPESLAEQFALFAVQKTE